MIRSYYHIAILGFVAAFVVTGFSCHRTETSVYENKLYRTPYIQLLSNEGVTIRWSTLSRIEGVVKYGTNPSELNSSKSSGVKSKDHSVRLSGLKPGTKYYYAVVTGEQTFFTDTLSYFKTYNDFNPDSKTTIWVIGDAGSGRVEQNQVRDAYLQFSDQQKPDFWLWLGDNAYEKGKEEEYQKNVFTGRFEDIMRNTPVFATIGNHDIANMGYQNFFAKWLNFSYFNIFDFPSKGELGGVPSGSKHYYSFDHQNIHFICLDSYISKNDPSSKMYKWLEKDLNSNNKKWTIVFFSSSSLHKRHS